MKWAVISLLLLAFFASNGQDSPPAAAYRIGNGVSAPLVRSKKEPEYSQEARNARAEGTVTLSLVVDKDGMPRNITATKRLGFGLDEKAIEAVEAWRFVPGQKDGNPVPVMVTIQVNFRLVDAPAYWRVDRAEYNLPAGASRPSVERPEFPPFSHSQETGSVTLTLEVDEHGNPINIHVEKSSDPKWEEEVMAAARKWKFSPSQREGTAISVPLTLTLTLVPAPAKAQ